MDNNLDTGPGEDASRLSLQQLQSAVAEISRALDEALRDDAANATKYLQRAQAVLASHAHRPANPASNSGPRLVAWQVRRVQEHIEQSLGSPIRNRDLASLVKLSEFHFCAAFRNSVGHSPHEFIIQKRMKRARELMLSTSLPLCDIAMACGLADQAHLSRLFRRVVGESPAAWRRAQS